MAEMDIVPLRAVPSQELTIYIGNQPTKIAVYQKRTGLFIDISVNAVPVVTGVLCRDRTWIIRSAYHGYSGDFSFLDTQGTADPEYTGLGSRYVLAWSAGA